MEIIFFMVAAAMIIAVIFVSAFIWTTKKGQYDDLDTPAYKMLLDDEYLNKNTNKLIKKRKCDE